MEELIYKIDNWTLIKVFGGITVIITAILAFFSRLIEKKIQHKYNYKIQNLKAEITKSNNLFNSSIENYLHSSQKIVDKKIIAYEKMWKIINETRDLTPAVIYMIHYLFPTYKFEEKEIFNIINENQKISPVIKDLEIMQEMDKMGKVAKPLAEYKFYLSDESYKLFTSYANFCFRVTHCFIFRYEKKEIYNWKKDKELKDKLESVLTENEMNYILKNQFDSFNVVINLMEHKIMNDIRNNLNIVSTTNDTIQYLKDIERIVYGN